MMEKIPLGAMSLQNKKTTAAKTTTKNIKQQETVNSCTQNTLESKINIGALTVYVLNQNLWYIAHKQKSVTPSCKALTFAITQQPFVNHYLH